MYRSLINGHDIAFNMGSHIIDTAQVAYRHYAYIIGLDVFFIIIGRCLIAAQCLHHLMVNTVVYVTGSVQK